MRTSFAPASASREDTAGPANPEKIGTCTAPMCAHACAAIAASGAIGRNVPTASPSPMPTLAERLGEPANLVRHLGPRQRPPLAVFRHPHRRFAVGCLRSPPVDARVRDVEPRSDEPRRPLDAARVVEHGAPVPCERDLEVADNGSPEPIGLVDRDAMQLLVPRAAKRIERAAQCSPKRAAPRSGSTCSQPTRHAIFAEPLITERARGPKGDSFARRPASGLPVHGQREGGPAGGNRRFLPATKKRPRLRLRGRFPFEATPSRGGEPANRGSAAQPRSSCARLYPAVVPAHPIWRPIVCGVGLTIGASFGKVK